MVDRCRLHRLLHLPAPSRKLLQAHSEALGLTPSTFDSTYQTILAEWWDMNTILYYLISPHEGQSVYEEHLATKGEGFHHTCIAYPDLEDVRSARDELLSQGRTLIQSGGHGDLFEFYYFEIPETDSIFELLYLSELPPPEATIG